MTNVDHGAVAQNLLDMRVERTSFFPSEIFDEHAWVMLLNLFIRQSNNCKTSLPDLYDVSDVGEAVGRRWINHLVHDKQIAVHQQNNEVRLTESAWKQMTDFLASEGMKRIRD